MIDLFKNTEIRRSLFLQFVFSLIASALVFAIDIKAGWIITALSVILMLIHTVTAYRRYKRISNLAADINKLLHGDSSIDLDGYSEGELGILQSEIYKMTVRLREQKQGLINDKVYLANSIADISHQIRTPLTSLNLMVELLSDHNIKENRRPMLIHELKLMLARIDWLITTLLKISRLDAGTVQFKSETVRLDTLIHKSCSTLLIPIELRRLELIVHAEGNFYGDISWTAEAIGNVVKNCMEHTPPQGTIEIQARETPLYSEIIIKDTGTGIEKEDLPYIFDRFYKGKNSDNKSFGVGLALARMIITGQNGTVKAENRSPSGALFTIRFYKGTV